MNKERFHNALAINLGYDRIVNDRHLSIKIDETVTDPVVTLAPEAGQHSFRYNASEDVDAVWMKIHESQSALALEQEIKEIIDAVHQAYIDANTSTF